jgi:hypothetical protein
MRQIGHKKHRKKISGKQKKGVLKTIRERKRNGDSKEVMPTFSKVDMRSLRAAQLAFDRARSEGQPVPDWAARTLESHSSVAVT